jgi:hypothetical protein
LLPFTLFTRPMILIPFNNIGYQDETQCQLKLGFIHLSITESYWELSFPMDGVAWWLLDRSQWNTIQRPSSAHHPEHHHQHIIHPSNLSIHPPNNTRQLLALGNSRERSSGNHHRLVLYWKRTRGQLFTIPCRWWQGLFFVFLSGPALSSAKWQLVSGLAGHIIGLWMSARGGQ